MAGGNEAKLKLGSFHVATDPETGKPVVLGRGAMGVTYKAIQSPLNRPVALKVITESLIDDEDSKERFLREARALASLYHSNIVTIYDFGEEDDTFFYAMEFIDGRTLADVILKEGRFGIGDALRITSQVANALHAAEEKGLVHRDIKPANIMLRETRENPLHVTLIDFGLVKALNPEDSLFGTIGGFKGTPVFSSPEQLEEHTLDIRSDIYSLGVTLWFTLTGKPPFAASSMARLIQAHLGETPPFEILEDQPQSVRELLARMLEKEPGKRQQSAGELCQELKNCLAGIPADLLESGNRLASLEQKTPVASPASPAEEDPEIRRGVAGSEPEIPGAPPAPSNEHENAEAEADAGANTDPYATLPGARRAPPPAAVPAEKEESAPASRLESRRRPGRRRPEAQPEVSLDAPTLPFIDTAGAGPRRYPKIESIPARETSWGVEYGVTDARENRELALREIRPDLVPDPSTQTSIEEAVARSSQYDHPNLMRSHAVETAPGADGQPRLSIVTDCVAVPLSELAGSRKSLDLSEVLAILDGVVAGAHYCLENTVAGATPSFEGIKLKIPALWQNLTREQLLSQKITEWPEVVPKIEPFSLPTLLGLSAGPDASTVPDEKTVTRDIAALAYRLLGGSAADLKKKRLRPLEDAGTHANEVLRACLVENRITTPTDLLEALKGRAPAPPPAGTIAPPEESAASPNRLPIYASIGTVLALLVIAFFVFPMGSGQKETGPAPADGTAAVETSKGDAGGKDAPAPPPSPESTPTQIALAAASKAWTGRDYAAVRAHVTALEKEHPDGKDLGDSATALFEKIATTLGSATAPAELEAGSPAQLDAWKGTVAFIARTGNAGAAQLLESYPWQWLRQRALAGDAAAASSIVAALLAGELGASPAELASWKDVVERSAGNGNKDAENILPAYPWILLRDRVVHARAADDDPATEAALRNLLEQDSGGQRIAGDAELLDIAMAVFPPPSEAMAPVLAAVKAADNRETLGKVIDWLQPGDPEAAHALFKKWADLDALSDKEAIEVSLRIAASTDSESKRALAVLSLDQIFTELERQSREDEEPTLRKLKTLQPLLVDAAKLTDSAKVPLARLARDVGGDAKGALALYLDIDEAHRPPHYHSSVGMLYAAVDRDVANPFARAIEEFRKDAKADYLCQYALAECYLLGNGVAADAAKGFELIGKLAEMEDMPPEVYRLYARCHDPKWVAGAFGGLKKDDATAQASYHKAFDAYRRLVDSAEKHAAGRRADLLSPRLKRAYADLGRMHLLGDGTAIDPTEAMPLFEKGIEAGDPDSMFLWAIVYIVDSPEWTRVREQLKGTSWAASTAKQEKAKANLKTAAGKGHQQAKDILVQLQ